MEMAMKIFENTPQFKQLGARIPQNLFPNCEQFKFRSRSYWDECHANKSATSFSHGAGTCSMGKRDDDPSAVLDSKLRVNGIRGLRVVDSSVMPTVTNANLQAAVYAIAEKASNMILQRWRTAQN